MQTTTNLGLKKPDYTDFADIQDINENMDTIDAELAAPTGDGRDQTVSFTDADLDSGITSFPTFLAKIVSGMKLAKFLRDFKAGMAYVLHVGSLVNNATCTESGKALDARMGKTLQDQITSLNDSLVSLGRRDSSTGGISIKGSTGKWEVRTLNGFNTAFLFFSFGLATSNIITSDNIITLSGAFKPANATSICGMVVTDTGAIAPGSFTLNPDGTLREGASSFCRAGWGVGFYMLS